MTNKERIYIALLLTVVATLTVWDIWVDFEQSASWWHLLTEGIIALIAGAGVVLMLTGLFNLKERLTAQQRITRELESEAQKWRDLSKKYMDGLSAEIEQQLIRWGLTQAEKEVAFLLLKGMSDKEIASLRGTSARTVRTQTGLIYAKSGLTGRTSFQAFFLEDLMLPPV